MSKQRRLIVILTCFVVTAGLVVFLTRDQEPQYQGRPLSAWLNDIEKKPSSYDATMAHVAVAKIGTNALPELRRRIRFSPAAWRTRLIQWKNKLPAQLRNTETARRLDYDRDYARQLEALLFLQALGAAAAPAVSDVAMVVTNRGNRYHSPHSLSALLTLTRLGPAAVPALTNLLADFTQKPSFIWASTGGGPEKRLDYRIFMIGGFREIGAEAAPAIPALLETMKSTNAEIVLASVTAVGSIRRHPELAVPALVNALNHPDEDVRVAAAKGLALFGKDAVTAIPKLKSMNREFGKVGKATRRAVHVINALAKGEEPDPDY